MDIDKACLFRMLFPGLLCSIVYVFSMSVWGQDVDSLLESDDSLLSKYFYLDLQSLYFPIPVSFTQQVTLSDANGEGNSSLRFSIPVEDIGLLRINEGHTRIDQIRISIAQPDLEASEPPYSHLIFDSEFREREISIIRFKVDPSQDELQSLKNTCFDKFVVGIYEIAITSEDCSLSKRLVTDSVID